VARPRDPAIAARNEEIYSRWYAGESIEQLAERFDRKPVVVGRIIKKRIPEQTDETNRALMRGRLEWALSEMRDVIVAPGFKLGPAGGLAHDSDGEPVPDLTTKIEATKVYVGILERMARSEGSDKPQQKDVHHTLEIADQQRMADIARRRAELEALTRQPPTITAEVLPAIEPPEPGQPAA
jgi:hypothetical protein